MSASKSKPFDGNKSTKLKANSNHASNIGFEDEPSIQVDPVFQKKSRALPYRSNFYRKERVKVTLDCGTVTLGCGTVTLFGKNRLKNCTM